MQQDIAEERQRSTAGPPGNGPTGRGLGVLDASFGEGPSGESEERRIASALSGPGEPRGSEVLGADLFEGEAEARRLRVVEGARSEARRRCPGRDDPPGIGEDLDELGPERRIVPANAERLLQLAGCAVRSPPLALCPGPEQTRLDEARRVPGETPRCVPSCPSCPPRVATTEGNPGIEERQVGVVGLDGPGMAQRLRGPLEVAEGFLRLGQAHRGPGESVAFSEHLTEELRREAVVAALEGILGRLEAVPDGLREEQDVVDETADAIEERHEIPGARGRPTGREFTRQRRPGKRLLWWIRSAFRSYPVPVELPASDTPPDKKDALIVVAEDDRMTREYVAGLLKGNGFRVETVQSGQEAIDRVTRGGVDLVLLDIMMPGLSGLDSCRLIKTLTKDSFLPVMLLTAKTDTDSRVEGLKIGADDYICKPFDERELLARVGGMLRIKGLHDDVHRAKRRLTKLAVQDELTGLYNYRYLHTRLAEEFKRAERYRDPLACAMVDIDHFKQFNDQHGHDVGDAVLAEVAHRIRGAVREIDVVARYGGEEFLLVLPSTHFSGALTVADRVWRAVGGVPVRKAGKEFDVTVSLGIALYPSRDVRTKDQLLKAADRALYQAKDDGRDRICVFQHQGYIYKPDVGS